MQIKKSLNSSVVLLEIGGKEAIAIGKGIGYGKKPGMSVSEQEIEQVFYEMNTPQVRQILGLVEEIPEVFFSLSTDIIKYAKEQLGEELNPAIFFSLTDHIHFALERHQKGIVLTNRVFWDVKNYYPQEFAIGLEGLNQINKVLGVELPQEEAANIAFHIINGRTSIEKSDTMEAAKLIGEIVNLIKYRLSIDLNQNNIHYKRFVTHIRFFVERYFSDSLLDSQEDDDLLVTVYQKYPKEAKEASYIRDYVVQKYHKSIPAEEMMYLTIHINRIVESQKG